MGAWVPAATLTFDGLVQAAPQGGGLIGLGRFASLLLMLNLLLCAFNLLPVHPLDGASVLAGVATVALLGAESPRVDDEHPVVGETATRDGGETLAHVVGQGRGPRHVETQLHRGRDLVHVLTARPGGAHEVLLELGLVDRHPGSHPEHVRSASRLPVARRAGLARAAGGAGLR